MKPILIITPFFAPQTHAAMFRVFKLVKYLPRYGYKPYVITVDKNYIYNKDPALLKELPNCVEIITVKYIEPSLRGLRMLFGGKDRTFSAVKKLPDDSSQVILDNEVHGTFLGKVRSVVGVIYAYMIRNFLQIPDQWWTWRIPAYRACVKLIKQHDIKIIYTTAPHITPLQLGIKLKKNFNIAWVSDHRDPIGYGEKYASEFVLKFKLEHYFVRKSLEVADKVVAAFECCASIYSDLYDFDAKKFHFIPTGADDEYLSYYSKKQDAVFKENNYLLFVGEFLPEYTTDFFDAFIFSVKNNLFKNKNLKIVFLGRKEINQFQVHKLAGDILDVFKRCLFVDHVSQKDVYYFINQARAVILGSGRYSRWYAIYAKLTDYIVTHKNVIACVPNPSEARKELERCGLGYFLDGAIAENAQILADVVNNEAKQQKINHEYCRRYLASVMSKSFVNIFDLFERIKA
jgi:hypothetical protein